MRRAIRQANRSADGGLRVPRAQARAPPARRGASSCRRSRTGSASRTSRSRAARAGSCSTGVSVEFPRRVADRDHEPRRGRQARPGLPDPPPDRPQGRPGPDRRPRPPRRDARVDPRPGRDRPPGRPGLHRLGRDEHRPGRPELSTCPGSSRPPRSPTPTTSSRTCPHGYDTVIGPLGHYLKPDEQYRIALARAYLHDPSIVIIEEPNVPLDDDTKHLIDDTIARLAAGPDADHPAAPALDDPVVRPDHRPPQRPGRVDRPRPASSRPRASSTATSSTSSSTSSPPARSRPGR